jgi:hypothetical protein
MNEGEVASFNELATRTSLHWMTVERYLSLLHFIHGYVPRMEIVEAGRSKAVRIKLNPMIAGLDGGQQLLLKLYRNRAATPETAIRVAGEEANAASALAEKGQVKLDRDNNVRLTRAGLVEAAEAFGQFAKDFDEGIQPSFGADEAEPISSSTKGLLQELSDRQAKMEMLIQLLAARADLSLSPKAPKILVARSEPDLDFSSVTVRTARRRRELSLESPLPNSA